MTSKIALRRIQSIPELQKKYNIFTYIDHSAADKIIYDKNADLQLANLTAGIKDNIVTQDMPTTCASKILLDYMSPFDATCVKLLRDAGALLVGKTNLDEFGMGSTGTHSFFGPVKNPLFDNQDIVAGGSSSGSAAAVAADATDFALGTDTGGSVRLPAAYTSILGFKPSYGRISRYGVIAYAQSLDTVGIMAKEFSVLRKVFDVLDKYDEKDPTSLSNDLRAEISALHTQKSTYRIGIPKEFFQGSLSKEVVKPLSNFLDKLLRQGHELYPVSAPSMKFSLPIYFTLSPAEATSNLARFDGIRYGTRSEKGDYENETLFAPTRSFFGNVVQDRLILGNYTLCSETFKDSYIKAQKLRVKLIDEFDKIFKFPNLLTGSKGHQNGLDLILALTNDAWPKPIDYFNETRTRSPTNEYKNDVFVTPMSLAGLPAVSFPLERGVPIGVQLAGQYGDDSTVLDACSLLVNNNHT
ncbi:related to Glutamyl-tRNA(Gln) amidotransferase subunit A, mitochondrial [Zygosaccharomyces bailii ISA1307]|nr:related to Glutamyl-tRNA(Gln) amidotransferase subunit A, mitochondrial [Zygosaccharomyces bailii ISA1307]